jgi:hypothetical protein
LKLGEAQAVGDIPIVQGPSRGHGEIGLAMIGFTSDVKGQNGFIDVKSVQKLIPKGVIVGAGRPTHRGSAVHPILGTSQGWECPPPRLDREDPGFAAT